MNHNTRNKLAVFRSGLWLVLVALILTSGQAFAQDNDQKLKPEFQMSGKRTLAAFQAVVGNARLSTVEIWCNSQVCAYGAVLDEEGHIITKASELQLSPECRFHDGATARANIIAVDRECDLALLKVTHDRLVPIKWAEQDFTDVGRWVATPCLDELPRAVGVVAVGQLKIKRQGGNGELGVNMDQASTRPKIEMVTPFSSASRAGLKTGDVILQLAEYAIDTRDALQERVKLYKPGDTFFLRILRGHEYLNLHVTMGSNIQQAWERQGIQNRMGGKLSARRAGFEKILLHDTVLNPEECGGPIVNLKGEAIGLNIARAGRTETYALPVSILKKRIEELMSGRLAVVYPDAVAPELEFVSEKMADDLPEPPPPPE
ncbi:MAG TPA: PDZ domain-containing protein [Planctomycetaceae bacterium]|nr:PDZ domain-containing protein [Planctomycetaceae bacterium]